MLLSGMMKMTQSVFVLQHLHVLSEDEEEDKFIGVYSSRESALRAVDRLRLQPGFRDFPALVADLGVGPAEGSGFYLNEVRLDQDSWPEGFVTV